MVSITKQDHTEDQSFHVRTDPGGSFVKGYPKEKDAKADAGERSARAKDLGFVVRYAASPKA